MPEINLVDFFTHFIGTPEQKEAVQLLQSSMSETLLRDKSAWVVKYREQPEPAPVPEWTGYFTPKMMSDLTDTRRIRLMKSSATTAIDCLLKQGFKRSRICSNVNVQHDARDCQFYLYERK